VLDEVQVSRRTIDKRFVEALGHPTAEEIRLARPKRARELLSTTDMLVVMVGLSCGYESPGGFSRAFHEASGVTPQPYRRQMRAAGRNDEE
jgi:transcriptional regulator GlxA family with amidase domain